MHYFKFIKLCILSTVITISTDAYSQVGINTNTPQQALDVNGRIQVGDDPTAADTEGALKYNQTTNNLEGYAQGQWQSLTGGSNVPTGAELVVCRITDLDNDSSAFAATFTNKDGVAVVNTAVPSGKFLLITHISLTPVSLFDFDTEEPFYSLRFQFGTFSNRLDVSGKYTGGTLYQNQAGYSPIAVVDSGQSLQITNFLLSSGFEQFDAGLDVFITGFLVDDLNFD